MENKAFDPSGEPNVSHEPPSKLDENSDNSADDVKQRLNLKRKVGLFSGVALIVGTMIGSGIFITPGNVLKRAGSVGMSLVLWTSCGILSILGSLCYAELGTLIPKAGGEYAYYMEALGSLHPFWGPLPAFLYSWLLVLFIRPAGLAASSLSVAKYTVTPLINVVGVELTIEERELLTKLVAILYLGLTISINIHSVTWTMKIFSTFTITKVVAIIILVGCGVYQLCNGETKYLEQGFEGSNTDIGTLAIAFYGCLWAYDGWNNLNYVTEELENPSVNLSRAIMIAIPIVMACYVFVNIAYLTVLSPDEMVTSSAVAVDMGNRMLGPMAFVVPLSVIMSTFGALVGGGFANARTALAAGREGHMVGILSHIHVDKRTPIPALVLLGTLSMMMVVVQDLAGLIDFCTFAFWLFYVVSMILIISLRKIRPNAHRPYRVPLIIPFMVIVIGSYLVVAPIISNPAFEYLFILGAAFVGFLVYIPFVYYKYSVSCMEPLTCVIQQLLYVGPSAQASYD